MASDVTRDELAKALAATGVIIEGARLLHGASGDAMFLAAVRYPGAVAEELLAHIEDGRKAVVPAVTAATDRAEHREAYERYLDGVFQPVRDELDRIRQAVSEADA